MNSDLLEQLDVDLGYVKLNVSEADIADMAKQEGPRGVINTIITD